MLCHTCAWWNFVSLAIGWSVDLQCLFSIRLFRPVFSFALETRKHKHIHFDARAGTRNDIVSKRTVYNFVCLFNLAASVSQCLHCCLMPLMELDRSESHWTFYVFRCNTRDSLHNTMRAHSLTCLRRSICAVVVRCNVFRVIQFLGRIAVHRTTLNFILAAKRFTWHNCPTTFNVHDWLFPPNECCARQ